MKKPLPKLTSPTLVCDLPVSKQKVHYRPFVVGEQKALLLAQESKDSDTIMNTIRDVVLTCANGMDIFKLPVADVSYFFLQLRIASVGPDIKFSIKCNNCEEDVAMMLDLSLITIDMSKSMTEIKLTDEVGMVMRYPTLEDAYDVKSLTANEIVEFIKHMIVSIYDSESVYTKDDYTDEELTAWILGMSDYQLDCIKDYMDNIPTLSHKLEFECNHCKTKQSRLLEGLHSFFRLGLGS